MNRECRSGEPEGEERPEEKEVTQVSISPARPGTRHPGVSFGCVTGLGRAGMGAEFAFPPAPGGGDAAGHAGKRDLREEAPDIFGALGWHEN